MPWTEHGFRFLRYSSMLEAEKDFPGIRLWYTMKDYALLHGIKYATVRRWMSENRFPEAVYVGGSPRIDPETPIPEFERKSRARSNSR